MARGSGSNPILNRLQAMPHVKPSLKVVGGASRPAKSTARRSGKIAVPRFSPAKGGFKVRQPRTSDFRMAMTAQAGSGQETVSTDVLQQQNAELDALLSHYSDMLSQLEGGPQP